MRTSSSIGAMVMSKIDKNKATSFVKNTIQQYVAGGIDLNGCADLITSIFLQEIARLEAEIEELEESHIVGGWGQL
jgi:hypothetical protein